MKRRRLILVLVMLVAVAAVLGGCLYDRYGGYRDWMPGVYRAPSFSGKGEFVLQLAADGSAVWEDFPEGAVAPKRRKTGRWRLAGSVLVYEEGASATKPIGIVERIAERNKTPLLTAETWTSVVKSADRTGLVLDLGGAVWTLRRDAER